jgi:hypothetical protein
MRYAAAVMMVAGTAAMAWGQGAKVKAAGPEQFDTAEAAAQALIQAAAANDTEAVKKIFGPGNVGALSSGKTEQDEQERKEFSEMAAKKNAIEPDPMNKNRMILSVGEEDWPFPAPIVKKNGKWSFAVDEAKVELRARRIGANELDVVEVCMGYVEAQEEFAAAKSDGKGMQEYAQKAMSAAGKRDGLYWEGETSTGPPAPKRFAEAVVDEVKARGEKPTPYHGYYFRILKAQGANAPGGAHHYVVKGHMIGGFGLAAWPAEYGVTGVQTFVVNQDGVVFEKDLGAAKAGTVTEFNPDTTWKEVD